MSELPVVTYVFDGERLGTRTIVGLVVERPDGQWETRLLAPQHRVTVQAGETVSRDQVAALAPYLDPEGYPLPGSNGWSSGSMAEPGS